MTANRVGRAQQGLPIIIPPSGVSNDWATVLQVDKFGNNPNIGTLTDPEDVWSQGGTYTFLSSAATLYASCSAASTVTIFVEGLDANYNIQTATVTLNGQNQAEIGSGLTWLRVYRAYNSSGTNLAGDVYIAETDDLTGGVPDTASKIKAKILTNEQQTLMAIYTIPAGYTGYLLRWYVSEVNPKSSYAIVELQARAFGGVFRVRRRDGVTSDGNSRLSEQPPIAYAFTEKTDIKVVVREVGANDMDISAGFDLLLVSNG